MLTMCAQYANAVSSSGGDISFSDDRCIHNCIECGSWEGASCCVQCEDSTGGAGGGGGGFALCISAGCNDISSRTEWQDTGSSASVLGDSGATGTTNVCFDIDGIKYYAKSATGCKTNYTRKTFEIRGCPSTLIFYKCLYNKTTSPSGSCDESTCVPDEWETLYSGSNAIQMRTFRSCNGNMCTTNMTKQIRCPKGYYGTPKTSGIGASAKPSQYCTPCPSHSSGTQTTANPGDAVYGGNIGVGGTSGPTGEVSVSKCYVPSSYSTGSDTTGSWACTSNAYYQWYCNFA